MGYVYIILGLAVGIAIGYLLANGRQRGASARAEMLERQLDEAKVAHEQQTATTKEEHEAQLATLKAEHEQQFSTLKEDFKEQTKQQMDFLREQFTTASERELKIRTAELSERNVEQLSKILDPLNERIKQMKEAVTQNEKSQTEATSRLGAAIKLTGEQAEKLGKTTDSLVSALSHDNKYQGSFGEMQLRQLLEELGFVRGIQFEEQETIRDDNGEAVHHETTGSRMQPDVVLHFPDKRDIIIDAKTSMTAFLRYNDASLPETERQRALKDHITAVKTQVKNLAKKEYWREYNKKGIKLDFVVMFVPSEGAMQLAVTEDPKIWSEAFDQGVFVTGPQNLYALLRLLEMSWKHMAQMENQQNIIDCANDIVSRVQMFNERLKDVTTALRKTQESFDLLDTITATSGRSIITSARKLLSYGAKEDKKHKNLPIDSTSLLLDEDAAEDNE